MFEADINPFCGVDTNHLFEKFCFEHLGCLVSSLLQASSTPSHHYLCLYVTSVPPSPSPSPPPSPCSLISFNRSPLKFHLGKNIISANSVEINEEKLAGQISFTIYHYCRPSKTFWNWTTFSQRYYTPILA